MNAHPAPQGRLRQFDRWYRTEVVKITGSPDKLTSQSARVLQEAVLRRTTGQDTLLTMDQLALVAGVVPAADVPLILVHSQRGWLAEAGLASNFFFEGSTPLLSGDRYVGRMQCI